MNETAKAMRRRFVESQTGKFCWMKIFRGKGIDVGCGPDKLPFDECIGFDKEDGDANYLSNYFEPESFDYLHASQALEHMISPTLALQDWARVVKPKGHIIFSVPDWVLYEGCQFPSKYNPDHKSSWSLFYHKSNAPIHCYIPEFLADTVPQAEVCRAALVDHEYDYKTLWSKDQTWVESDCVEAFIEVVLRLPSKPKNK